MENYVFKKRSDHSIIDVKKTWEKLLLAARVIASIENPADVCVISSRNFGQVRLILYLQQFHTSDQLLLCIVWHEAFESSSIYCPHTELCYNTRSLFISVGNVMTAVGKESHTRLIIYGINPKSFSLLRISLI